MTLQEKLDAYQAGFKEKVPAETAALMHRATEELRSSGLVEGALKVGDKLPDFALPDTEGEIVRSQALLAKGPLVVSIYRGVW